MSANIKASTDGTQAIIGVGGVDQMTISNAGVVTANSFVGAISGNASSATALATGSTTARTLANRFADVVNVKDFGAVGDGITDNAAAIQAAVNVAGQSKKVYIPSGIYYCSAPITSNLATSFSGDGISETTLLFNGNGFIISPNNDNGSVEINNIAFHKKNGAVSGTAIKYDGSAQQSGGIIVNRTSPRFYFNNIAMRGEGDPSNSGWLNGIVIDSGIHGIIDGIHFEGMVSGSLPIPTYLSSKAISFIGTGFGVEFLVKNSWVFYSNFCVYVDKQEGIFVDSCNFVAVDNGVYVESTDLVERPQLNVTNTHINFNNFGIYCNEQAQVNASNNLIYLRDSAPTNGVGIFLIDSVFSNIHSNIIVNTSSTYNIDSIVCNGDCTGTSIYNNTFQGASTAVWLKSTSSGVTVGSNTYVSVGTRLLDQGTNNTAEFSLANNRFIANNNGNIEFGRQDGVAQSTFIDFHSSGFANNFDARIACNGGNALDYNGVIRFTSESCEFYGPAKPQTDGTTTLGTASNRWSVVYATTGTINTSDEREKTFLEIENAEKSAALEIKSNLRKFKFNSAIDQKGENARIHFGASAQQVGDIMKSHGLDPNKYGFYCYDEWNELEEVKDNDGNIIQEYRPAGNRYGLRYEELLAFIISAI
jgi:hypothetical protein